MKIRVLGCSGAIAKDCRTTSFLVDDDVLIDAGTGVGDLDINAMRGIRHVFLSHSHLDHIAALPLMADTVGAQWPEPLQVYGLPGTLAALREHVFNQVIWPDFTTIPSVTAPFIRLVPIAVGQTLQLGARTLEVLPAVHTVPAVGYAIREHGDYWMFSGDTGPNPGLWERVNALPVGVLVIETAFSNRERELAQRSLHLAPEVLANELDQIRPDHRFPIYITHTKPSEAELIMEEVRRFDQKRPVLSHVNHDIRWLSTGQEFEL